MPESNEQTQRALAEVARADLLGDCHFCKQNDLSVRRLGINRHAIHCECCECQGPIAGTKDGALKLWTLATLAPLEIPKGFDKPRQCCNCKFHGEHEGRYDQVICLNEDSDEALGDVEATHVCPLHLFA